MGHGEKAASFAGPYPQAVQAARAVVKDQGPFCHPDSLPPSRAGGRNAHPIPRRSPGSLLVLQG